MKKRLLSLLLAVVLAASLVPATAFGATVVESGYCGYTGENGELDGKNLTWTLDSNGLLTITGEGKMQNFTYDTVPWPRDNVVVVDIGKDVTSIGDDAFEFCENLTRITIPDSVISIGDYAFSGCHSLLTVNIPKGVTSIGDEVFFCCTSLTDINIPEGVTNIGIQALSGCDGITTITIPSSVDRIAGSAFLWCSGLTEIQVDKNNTRYLSDDGVLIDKIMGILICCPQKRTGTYSIPNYVTSIEEWAFDGCSSLTSISIPSSVSVIGGLAFNDCSGLSNVIIPNGVKSIGESAFYGCSNLTSVSIPKSIESIGLQAFGNCDALTGVYIDDIAAWCSIQFQETSGISGQCGNPLEFAHNLYLNGKLVTDLIIPNNIESIGVCSFNGCFSLKSIKIPSNITSIGKQAFRDCKNVSDISIQPGISTIEYETFCGCESLISIDIPNSVSIIDDSAFWYCEGLSNVSIPSSVTTIGDQAFSNCSNLSDITIPRSVKKIGESAFNQCKISTVDIPTGVSSIEPWTFRNCNYLSSVSIPNSVKSIGYSAFELCTNIKEINIPNSVSNIGRKAFSECTSLTDISIPNSVVSIGEYVFANCEAMRNVVLPNRLTTISSNSFYGCDRLSSVTIPKSVTHIGWSAFDICPDLKDVYYEGTEGDWNNIQIDSYNDCLKDVTIHYNCKQGASADGTSPQTSKLYLKSNSPYNICCAPGTPLTMEFSGKVKPSHGMITIWNMDTEEAVESISVLDSRVKVNGAKVTVNLDKERYALNTDYAVTVDSGAFVSGGYVFYGITKKNIWQFATDPRPVNSGFPLKYAKKNINGTEIDDTSKPPIPNGSKNDYAGELVKWMNNAGISGITRDDAKQMLDTLVCFPVQAANGTTGGDPLLMREEGTTVMQVMSDLIFVENLQPYIFQQDNELKNVKPFDDLGFSGRLSLTQEAKITNTMLSWSDQISTYMSERNRDSSFMTSSTAPLAYVAGTALLKKVAGGNYQFIKPFIEVTMKSNKYKNEIQSLQNISDYKEFEDTVEQLESIKSEVDTIFDCITDNKVSTKVAFGAKVITGILSQTGNSNACELNNLVDEVLTPVKFFAQHGVAGVVIKFGNEIIKLGWDMFNNNAEAARAVYFIGDYYISMKYPTTYKNIYSNQPLYPVESIYKDGGDALFESTDDTDPVRYNWLNSFMGFSSSLELAHRQTFFPVRKQLASYATLLNYVKSIEVDKAKTALAQYVSAELQQNASTTTYASCPVRIDVYDKDHTTLLASLSSEDKTIQSVPYGSFYLMGENNETKCFVYDPDQYSVEYVPYENGTMDVIILNGEDSGKYFESVPLREGDVFTTDELDPASGLTRTANGEDSVIDPTETVPDRGVNLYGPDSLAVHESDQMSAEVVPFIATDQSVYWSSSDESILSVDDYGTITAQSAGEATITATSASGAEAEKTIVTFVPVEELSLSTEGETISMLIGETFTPEIEASEEADLSRIHWQTGNPLAATVSPTGVVEAQSPGQTVITASVDGMETSYAVEVYDEPLEITLYQSDTQGDRIKLDLENHSIQTDFGQQVITAVYDESGRMVSLFTETPSIKAGDNQTFYYPIEGLSKNQKFVVKTFILDKNGTPIQTNGDGVLLGDIPVENSAS